MLARGWHRCMQAPAGQQQAPRSAAHACGSGPALEGAPKYSALRAGARWRGERDKRAAGGGGGGRPRVGTPLSPHQTGPAHPCPCLHSPCFASCAPPPAAHLYGMPVQLGMPAGAVHAKQRQHEPSVRTWQRRASNLRPCHLPSLCSRRQPLLASAGMAAPIAAGRSQAQLPSPSACIPSPPPSPTACPHLQVAGAHRQDCQPLQRAQQHVALAVHGQRVGARGRLDAHVWKAKAQALGSSKACDGVQCGEPCASTGRRCGAAPPDRRAEHNGQSTPRRYTPRPPAFVQPRPQPPTQGPPRLPTPHQHLMQPQPQPQQHTHPDRGRAGW